MNTVEHSCRSSNNNIHVHMYSSSSAGWHIFIIHIIHNILPLSTYTSDDERLNLPETVCGEKQKSYIHTL